MGKQIKISYEKVDDILYIGRDGRVKFSVDIALSSGDVIVDIGFDGLVKGVEIMNASDFFSLGKNELSKLKNADLNIVYGPSYVAISVVLGVAGKIPIKSNVVIPYNKRLAITA